MNTLILKIHGKWLTTGFRTQINLTLGRTEGAKKGEIE